MLFDDGRQRRRHTTARTLGLLGIARGLVGILAGILVGRLFVG